MAKIIQIEYKNKFGGLPNKNTTFTPLPLCRSQNRSKGQKRNTSQPLPCPVALQGIHLLTRGAKQNIRETVRSNGEAETTIEQRCLTPPLCFAKQNIGEVARSDGGVKTCNQKNSYVIFSTPPSKKGECHSCTPLPYLQVYRIKNSTIDREIGSYFRISLWQELSPSFSNFKI